MNSFCSLQDLQYLCRNYMHKTMTIQERLNTTDCFARNAGAQLVEVGDGYAIAQMTVTESHLNGGGVCQGGALFTLADLAFAAVTNQGENLAFGIQSSIVFSQSAHLGEILTAEARMQVPHHKLPYCEVTVYNVQKEVICVFTGLAYVMRYKKL